MKYITIKDWEIMQHYKKRNPPWIKLYAEMLDDETFEFMSDEAKLIYFCLLLFASRKGNKIRNDSKWINRKLPIDREITDNHISELIKAGFLVECDDDSDMLALRNQDAIPEKRRVEKSKEKKSDKETIFPIALDNPTFLVAWKEWVQFRAEIKKKLTPTTISKQLRMLENHGSPVAIGIINRSIQNGWQGLFPPEKTDSIPVVPRKDVQIAQWENQCGGWLRQSSKETIANHGSFMQRLKNPEFRKWAESVNVIVKEIQCNQ